jgi:hypothetical protein
MTRSPSSNRLGVLVRRLLDLACWYRPRSLDRAAHLVDALDVLHAQRSTSSVSVSTSSCPPSRSGVSTMPLS